MSRFQVTGVRMENAGPIHHEHISDVQIEGTAILSRQMVVNDIRNPGGDDYYTQAGGVQVEVVVVRCPNCIFNDYLRTDPDRTTNNNLLSLPRV
ncbi:MAG: DUF3892 domain-containing protein [Chloroflexota bacterium]|nr:MAG: DUF3892 domain-containing protein [Chloroflexota bacterium]